MRSLLLGLAGLLWASVAFAQGSVQQAGPFTAGHLPMILGNGRLMDGGGSPGAGQQPANNTNAGTLPTGLGIVNSGLGYCDFTGYANASYKSLCWGFDGSGNGLIDLEGTGSTFNIKINGTLYPFPGNGTGNVVGPLSATAGHIALWNNPTGTLLSDGGFKGLNKVFDVADYGAVCDGTTNDATAIQTAITAAQVVNGTVFFPGFCKASSQLNITAGVEIVGSGPAISGLLYGSTSGDVLNIQTQSHVNIHDIQIQALSYGISGAAISLNGTGGGGVNNYNNNTSIRNVKVIGTYDCLRLDNAANLMVFGLNCLDNTHDGILIVNSDNPDAGQDHFVGVTLQNLNRGTTPNAAFEYQAGGDVEIAASKLIGQQYGLLVNMKYGPTGTVLVTGSSFEEHQTGNILIKQATAGIEVGNIAITGNQFSAVGFPATYLLKVNTGTPTSAPKWVRSITFSGNVSNDDRTLAGSAIDIGDGDTIFIGGNALDNNLAAGPTNALHISAGVTNILCGPNVFANYASGPYDPSSQVVTCPVGGGDGTNSWKFLIPSFGVIADFNDQTVNAALGTSNTGQFYIHTTTTSPFVLGANNFSNLTLNTDGTLGPVSFLRSGAGNWATFTDSTGSMALGIDGTHSSFVATTTANKLRLGYNSSDRLIIDSGITYLLLSDFREGDGSAIATNATSGFVFISSGAGAPTGIPTNAAGGASALYYDTTNHKLWIYDQPAGAWRFLLTT